MINFFLVNVGDEYDFDVDGDFTVVIISFGNFFSLILFLLLLKMEDTDLSIVVVDVILKTEIGFFLS